MVSLRDRVGMFPPKQLETPYLVSRLERYIYSCHYLRAVKQGERSPGRASWRPAPPIPKRQHCKNIVKGKQPLHYGTVLNKKGNKCIFKKGYGAIKWDNFNFMDNFMAGVHLEADVLWLRSFMLKCDTFKQKKKKKRRLCLFFKKTDCSAPETIKTWRLLRGFRKFSLSPGAYLERLIDKDSILANTISSIPPYPLPHGHRLFLQLVLPNKSRLFHIQTPYEHFRTTQLQLQYYRGNYLFFKRWQINK